AARRRRDRTTPRRPRGRTGRWPRSGCRGGNPAPLLVDDGEPALVLGDLAPGGAEERLLDLLGDRSASGRADRPVVDLLDRTDFRGRPAEEGLVRRVQIRPDELAFANLVSKIAGDGDDGFAGDPVEASGGERWCRQHTVLDDEDVLARAIRHVAMEI